WGGHAPRPPTPSRTARRRTPGLLAGRGAGSSPSPSPASGNETPGNCVAAVRNPPRPGRLPDRANRVLRPARSSRVPLLVRLLAIPPLHLPWTYSGRSQEWRSGGLPTVGVVDLRADNAPKVSPLAAVVSSARRQHHLHKR